MGEPLSAERVLMSSLRAGDLVLSSPAQVTRVIVNQHVGISTVSPMVTLKHSTGELSLTPDHVLAADGAYRPAVEVKVGMVLEPASKVNEVTASIQGIISPITANGHILAAGPSGGPITATVWPGWIADWMLQTTLYPLPY